MRRHGGPYVREPYDGQDDVVQFGRRRRPSGRWPSGRRPSGRWPVWPVLLAAALLAVAVLAVVRHGGKPPAASAHGRTPAPVVVTKLGHPLLGATGSWELFGLSEGEAVSIQPAQGRIIRTTVPPLLSSGPVSFIAGRGQVIIRPLDFVPGYLVPDGRPARELAGVLGSGGLVFPGPAPGQVWVLAGNGDRTSLSLTAMDGTTLGSAIRVPGGDEAMTAAADGRGDVLVPRADGIYDARPGGLRLVTAGSVVAVGPTRWLAVECHRAGQCVDLVIDPASGARRILPGHSLPEAPAGATVASGTISPDGSTAAVFRASSSETSALQLIDLATGAGHQLAIQGFAGAGTTAWSPDSRWLFVAAAPVQGPNLLAVNALTRRVVNLGAIADVSGISQVAVDSTSR